MTDEVIESGAGLRFDPPGPGRWETLADHFPVPLTPEYQRILQTGFVEGYAPVCERYGLPLRTILLRLVHGHVYIRPQAVVGGDRALPAPPRAVAMVIFRLIPAMRRAARQAEQAIEQRRWLAEADEWRERTRPEAIRRNRALQSVAVNELAAGALAEHLRECRDNAIAGYRRHFELHGTDLLPTGILLVRGRAWAIDPSELLPLLTGHSPATSTTVLDDHTRWRSATGYDLDAKTYGELPGLDAHLRRHPTAAAPERSDDAEASLRERVPADARDEFDRLLADARATYGVRDDNGAILGAWTIGLLRRAMLATGRRLGLLDPEHAVELTVDELVARLGGSGEPTAADAAARAAERASLATVAAPPFLGPDEALPPVGALPRSMALLTAAMLIFRELNATAVAATGLQGTGIGTRTVVGRAVVAHDPNDAILRLEPGDVLVTPFTTPAYNVVLSYAGGVVVVEGGTVSHAAVIARELDLPALVGVRDAMTIPDGARVELDPVAGTVREVANTLTVAEATPPQ